MVIATSGASGTRKVVRSAVLAKGALRGIGRVVEVANQSGGPDNVSRDDLVFALPSSTDRNIGQDPSNLRKRFAAIKKAAKLDRRVRMHDLRHTFAVWLAREGVSLQDIQAYMGHSSVVTTQIYSRYAPDTSRARMLAEAAFGGVRIPDSPEALASAPMARNGAN